ncbi:reverse transcriptase domain-containing protein [Tanacetum coccineum]|uniref:Reverse transcriptase domain-containing protein n=1 Tax=Tanacetum coccineum TaxID=301880 RepID=A0ABQ5G2K4_9ASTR
MVDDQPMWGNNQAIAPTSRVAIVVVDLRDNFTVKGRGTIIQIFYHGLDESTQAIIDAKGIFIYKTLNKAHQLLEDRVLLKLDWSKDMKAKPIRKTVAVAESSNDSKLMEKMEAEVPKMKKPTMPTEVTEEEDIEETTTDLETKFSRLSDQCSSRPSGSLLCNTQTNPKPNLTNDKPYRPPSARNEHVNVVFTWSGLTYDPSVNPNAKTTIIHDDCDDKVDESEKDVEPSSSKQNKYDPPPLKMYKPKMPYPQCLCKEKMEKRYAKFIDLIKEVGINVPLVDVLAGMPNYRKFLKDLMSNKRSVEYLALADLGASINLIPYSMYASLSGNTLKPIRMSIRLANHTYQYPMGIAENMLVQVGNFVFLADFVIIQMDEEDKVPLNLGRPFLHTADAIIRVKNKELNLGVGDDRITFLINKAMRHSHSNDDTCFHIDVIDEVTIEELDALLDDSKPFSNTLEKISESSLDYEFKEFMPIKIKEIPEQEEEVENSFQVLPPEGNQRIKNSIQDPPTDLVMKPLPEHLEYAFLEKESLLPIVISALLQDNEKKRPVSIFKNHKEAFAWKTSDILGISPSFCKHKINFEDDAKPVIQRQRRLNPNMKEVMKKEIIKLLDAGIIYAIEDSPWLSPVHCVPKKGGMTVMTNKKNELVPTRTVTDWCVCIDYHKLNEATQKYHFPLPFMDQMLERFIQFLPRESQTNAHLMQTSSSCSKLGEVSLHDWSQPSELMCDASDFAVEAVLGQREGKHFRLIHFASKTLNNAQQNYMVNKKELLTVQDAKPRLICWILLLQDFDIEIKNKKGAENVVADHLSRHENPHLEELRDDDIDDNFHDETLMNVSSTKEDKIPWFVDFANYLVGKILRKGLTYA